MVRNSATEANASRRAEIGLERRNRTRERLIDAALAVVAEHGFDLPVIDAFIGAANVSRGTFYNYFRTKDELVSALCQRINTALLRHHDQIREAVPDLAERLIVGVRLNIRRAAVDPNWGRVYVQERLRRLGARRPDDNDGPRRDMIHAIEAGRLPPQPVDVALDLFYGALPPAIYRAVTGAGPEDLDQRVATFILAGLGMPYAEATEIARRPLPPDADVPSPLPEVKPTRRRRNPFRESHSLPATDR